ncbi:transcriptional regulator [Aliidiomarina sedimenti]|uniref:Transcriptional regulator n=1 Tax=Aliidiomarina sedimenti TaxID=1933879 RepID=A0ABY0C402_9GAMM|nr:helix-turn-helix domain-containing protein [Aliidiomarina sedimenti]RUO32178.1 transcriptional regulator [Aliidiomarina sedimenti]
MQKDQIKKGLADKGYDFSLLAEVIGKSPSLVSKVVSRKARSALVAHAIAKALGIPVETVFPDIPAYHGVADPSVDQRAAKRAELKAKLAQD